MEKICAFFGHRDVSSKVNLLIENAIRQLIDEEKVDTFWVGRHGNFESLAITVLKKLKLEYPKIKIILIISYVQQLHYYGDSLPFDGFDYPVDAELAPRKFAISARNKYIAKNADYIIAYVCRKYGGAYNALCIAKKHGKTIINLAEL